MTQLVEVPILCCSEDAAQVEPFQHMASSLGSSTGLSRSPSVQRMSHSGLPDFRSGQPSSTLLEPFRTRSRSIAVSDASNAKIVFDLSRSNYPFDPSLMRQLWRSAGRAHNSGLSFRIKTSLLRLSVGHDLNTAQQHRAQSMLACASTISGLAEGVIGKSSLLALRQADNFPGRRPVFLALGDIPPHVARAAAVTNIEVLHDPSPRDALVTLMDLTRDPSVWPALIYADNTQERRLELATIEQIHTYAKHETNMAPRFVIEETISNNLPESGIWLGLDDIRKTWPSADLTMMFETREWLPPGAGLAFSLNLRSWVTEPHLQGHLWNIGADPSTEQLRATAIALQAIERDDPFTHIVRWTRANSLLVQASRIARPTTNDSLSIELSATRVLETACTAAGVAFETLVQQVPPSRHAQLLRQAIVDATGINVGVAESQHSLLINLVCPPNVFASMWKRVEFELLNEHGACRKLVSQSPHALTQRYRPTSNAPTQPTPRPNQEVAPQWPQPIMRRPLATVSPTGAACFHPTYLLNGARQLQGRRSDPDFESFIHQVIQEYLGVTADPERSVISPTDFASQRVAFASTHGGQSGPASKALMFGGRTMAPRYAGIRDAMWSDNRDVSFMETAIRNERPTVVLVATPLSGDELRSLYATASSVGAVLIIDESDALPGSLVDQMPEVARTDSALEDLPPDGNWIVIRNTGPLGIPVDPRRPIDTLIPKASRNAIRTLNYLVAGNDQLATRIRQLASPLEEQHLFETTALLYGFLVTPHARRDLATSIFASLRWNQPGENQLSDERPGATVDEQASGSPSSSQHQAEDRHQPRSPPPTVNLVTSPKDSPDAVVLGAGVVGAMTGLRFLELGCRNVWMIAHDPWLQGDPAASDTASAAAAAQYMLTSKVPREDLELLLLYAAQTSEFYVGLGSANGLFLQVPDTELLEPKEWTPGMTALMPHNRIRFQPPLQMTGTQGPAGPPSIFTEARILNGFSIRTGPAVQHLLTMFQQAGGHIIQSDVSREIVRRYQVPTVAALGRGGSAFDGRPYNPDAYREGVMLEYWVPPDLRPALRGRGIIAGADTVVARSGNEHLRIGGLYYPEGEMRFEELLSRKHALGVEMASFDVGPWEPLGPEYFEHQVGARRGTRTIDGPLIERDSQYPWLIKTYRWAGSGFTVARGAAIDTAAMAADPKATLQSLHPNLYRSDTSLAH